MIGKEFGFEATGMMTLIIFLSKGNFKALIQFQIDAGDKVLKKTTLVIAVRMQRIRLKVNFCFESRNLSKTYL